MTGEPPLASVDTSMAIDGTASDAEPVPSDATVINVSDASNVQVVAADDEEHTPRAVDPSAPTVRAFPWLPRDRNPDLTGRARQ